MADRQLQGWCADPFQLHEERYFSAGRPTKLVRDGKLESYEDPPSHEVPDDEDEEDGFAPAAATGSYAAGRYAARRYVASRHPAGSYVSGPWPRVGVTVQYARDDSATQAVRAQAVRRRSRALLIVAAMAIVGATVAGLLVLAKQESRSTPNPNQPTATLSGSVQSAGHAATIGGTGAINFGTIPWSST